MTIRSSQSDAAPGSSSAPALVNLLIAEPEEVDELRRSASALPSLRLNQRALCDLEMLAVGAYSPLERLMGRVDLDCVLETLRLANGSLFPLSVTLPVAPDDARSISIMTLPCAMSRTACWPC